MITLVYLKNHKTLKAFLNFPEILEKDTAASSNLAVH